jgi:hypothetical protein
MSFTFHTKSSLCILYSICIGTGYVPRLMDNLNTREIPVTNVNDVNSETNKKIINHFQFLFPLRETLENLADYG